MVLVLGLASGCSQVRLPAIDPSGESLFLPPPYYTTLVEPSDAVCATPRPVYPAAPSIPVCPEGGPPKPATPGEQKSLLHGPKEPKGKKGKLVLTPGKMTAPVGTEVVLLAGFCANDGFFMTDQPIQWHVAPGSVGHFVDVNLTATSWIHRRHSQLETDFALSRTMRHAMLLTRGTPNKRDDVTVRRGQSWITVTSPVQGTTHVTVVAPNSVDWNERRKTAVIHWIDARWQFPAPTSTRAGEPVTLVTRVTRRDGSPIRGWRIRYDVSSSPNLSFAETGRGVVEVPTDASGEGRVTLRQGTPTPESAQVTIQVIRPEENGAPLVIGRGTTAVHWSAPGLNIRAAGPTTLSVGEAGTYRIDVLNPGDVATRQVVVSVALPDQLELVSSQPQTQLFGTTLQWNIGDLGPRTTRTVTAVCRAKAAGDVAWQVVAQSADVARVESTVRTRITAANRLDVRFVNPPAAARVGDQATFVMEVRNLGNRVAPAVEVTDSFDEGLVPVEGMPSPIRKQVGDLGPGEVRQFGVQFRVMRAGRLCQRVQASSAGSVSASTEHCVEVQPAGAAPPSSPPPAPASESALRVHLLGPAQALVGEEIVFEAAVRNVGTTAQGPVEVTIALDPAFTPLAASERHERRDNLFNWTIDRLEPGADERVAVKVKATQARPQASTRVEARIGDQPAVQQTVETVVHTPAGSAAPAPAPTGGLRLTVLDITDPVRVGDRTTYVIRLKNEANISDQNVVLQIDVPPELSVEAIDGPVAQAQTSPDGRTITMQAVRELRPGETLQDFRVEVTARGPARQTKLVARARSARNPQGVTAEQTTAIVME